MNPEATPGEWRAVGRSVDNGFSPWQAGWQGWVVSAVEDAARLALVLNALEQRARDAEAKLAIAREGLEELAKEGVVYEPEGVSMMYIARETLERLEG